MSTLHGLEGVVSPSPWIHRVTPPEPLYRIRWSTGRLGSPLAWEDLLLVIRLAQRHRRWFAADTRPIYVESVA